MIKHPIISILLILLLLPATAATAEVFDRAAQLEVINAAADIIESRYVDEDKAHEIAKVLRLSEDRWKEPRNGISFAREATAFLRSISKDGHLGLSYSEKTIPQQDGDAAFSAAEMERWYGPKINHGVEKIERLPGNVIFLDLRVFPPPSMAGDVFAAAMTVVAQGDALIIDLRQNGGGAETANLLTGYLLEGGSPLSGSYNRPTDTHTYATSPAWVPGRRFGSTKPVYILTSHKTFSAAESVAYDLQALKRAVIVGETTGGGANPFEYRRIHPHFAVDLPESRSVNPITGTNWQGTGVKPDVEVPAEQALDKALELAETSLTRK
jgi:hypothetical protein